MTVAIGVLVDGPAPQAPAYTLIGAAQIVPMGEDEHYLNGLQVRSYPCGPAHTYDGWNHLNDDGSSTKTLIIASPAPGFRGFSVYLRDQCNTRGVGAQAFADRVNAIFPAVEAYAVEREFWTGAVLPDSPHLVGEIPVPGGADSTIYPSGSTAQTLLEGIAQLEAAIATTGRAGLIHLSPSALTRLVHLGNGVVTASRAGVLQTMLGTTLVPGYGYQTAAGVFNGSTPVPPAAHTAPTGTQEWMFATGPVEIRRSQNVEIIPEATEEALWEAIDRANNLITYEAVRHYVLSWDACFKAAVKVDRAT